MFSDAAMQMIVHRPEAGIFDLQNERWLVALTITAGEALIGYVIFAMSRWIVITPDEHTLGEGGTVMSPRAHLCREEALASVFIQVGSRKWCLNLH